MKNLLLEGYDLQADYLQQALRPLLSPHYRVAVIPFSFRDDRIRSAEDWDLLYGKAGGKYYAGLVEGFTFYGLKEENIRFVNYFTDTPASAAEKIAAADVLYFTGGLPDRMLERLREFRLQEVLFRPKALVVGYSAGAVLQLEEYHLSPDEDYAEFAYYEGLGYLKDFYLEVHYEGTPSQQHSIQKVLSERSKPVYATCKGKGALLVSEGKITPLGQVLRFDP